MKFEINPTATRVQMNSKPEMNQRVKRRIEARIKYYATTEPVELNKQINRLEEEWDTERVLETSFASVVIISSLVGYALNKKWIAVAGIAGIFMLQHALQGWCPPLATIRRAGIRTAEEISAEKFALKAMRGDFNHIKQNR